MPILWDLESSLIILAGVSSAAVSIYALAAGPRSVSHRFFALGMVILLTETILGGMSLIWGAPDHQEAWLNRRIAITSLVPGCWLMFALALGARNFGERFRRAMRLIVTAFFFFPLSLFLIHRGLFRKDLFPEPDGGLYYSLTGAGVVFHLVFIVLAVVLMVLLEGTLRSSKGVKRWQIKFHSLGILGYFAVRIYSSSHTLLFQSLDVRTETILSSGALILVNILVVAAFTRARVLPEDIYLSEKFISRSVVLLLVGSYLFGVGILTKLFSALGSPLSYQLMTFLVFAALLFLAVLLFSERFKVLLKDGLSRHFQRPRYDYRDIWTTFTEKTSSAEDTADLAGRTANFLAELLELLTVNIWLLDEKNGGIVLAGSTSLSRSPAREDQDPGWGENLLEFLHQETKPFDLHALKDSKLKKYGIEKARLVKGDGMRYVVPLREENELLGFISLDHRVLNKPMGCEEFDLLAAIGLQVSARIQNLKLSRQIQEAREVEALRRFSTFFLHDLKNVASKLSMMLSNFLQHYDNPDFREDALTLVSQTVDNINAMTRKLTEMKEIPDVNPRPADMSKAVGETISEIAFPDKVAIAANYGNVADCLFDPDQFSRVVTNLVMNAMEAVGEAGAISIRTFQENGWAILEVSDDGPGMTERFIATSLFRPFQTTKKKGLGIGLYQCRSIVQAHGGRMAVQSQQGKGTTFQVYLPCAPGAGGDGVS